MGPGRGARGHVWSTGGRGGWGRGSGSVGLRAGRLLCLACTAGWEDRLAGYGKQVLLQHSSDLLKSLLSSTHATVTAS